MQQHPSFSEITKAPPVGAFVFTRASSYMTRWRFFTFIIAIIVAIPLGVVFFSWVTPETEIWRHMIQYVLPELLINTAWLIAGVGLISGALGITLAWLTAVCEFPGRRFFSWALLLPLAIPTYVLAFVSIGLLDYTGPIQMVLRGVLDSQLTWFPPIRSRGGVIVILSLALYPYVYLLTRNSFLTQGKRTLEVAQSLGLNRRQGFFKVALPMARPWIAAGLALVLMEALADFGAVATFNYNTFTTAIYKAWFGLFSLKAASQLASLLIVIVFILIIVEQQVRLRPRYTAIGRHTHQERFILHGITRWLAFSLCVLVLGLAFIIPSLQLLWWAAKVVVSDFDQRYLTFVWHSLLLASLATLLITITALFLSYAHRIYPDLLTRLTIRLATLGYAVPGSVLAVGIFIPIAWLDNYLITALKNIFSWHSGPLLSGTLITVLIALGIRFLSVAYHPVDSAMQRITRSTDEASRTLGITGLKMIRHIHIPMLRGGLITAITLTFVDVMKEMPITLMTRPFGWDTLAIRIFEMTSEGQWDRAALPAITLVIVGLIPIFLLTKHTEQHFDK